PWTPARRRPSTSQPSNSRKRRQDTACTHARVREPPTKRSVEPLGHAAGGVGDVEQDGGQAGGFGAADVVFQIVGEDHGGGGQAEAGGGGGVGGRVAF